MESSIVLLIVIAITIILSVVALFINLLHFKKNKKLHFKSVAVQLLAITVWVALIANIFVPEQHFEGNTKIGLIIFMTSLVIGIFLIRSIFREIETDKAVEILIERLHENNAGLHELDRQKTEFISIASHQLRTPLSATVGYISMILDGDFGDVPEHLLEPLSRAFRSSKSLGILINDFLNVSRIEKGEMEYLMEDFDVSKTLKQLSHDFEISAKEKGLDLTSSGIDEEIIIRGDKQKVKQIISNIMDNSVKYTEKGGIYLTASVDKDEVTISIKDTGMGIDKSLKKEIFGKFVRDEEAINKDVGGTGLGLFVAAIMTEAMDGKIWAESAGRGQGSTFFVQLPLSK